MTIELNQLAHGRAGEKGDTLNISVIAWSLDDFEHLVTHVTEAHCRQGFCHAPDKPGNTLSFAQAGRR